MKVVELLEGELGDLSQVLLLMKHGKLDRAKATELNDLLKANRIMVKGQFVPANLRWTEDKKIGCLKMASADIPGTWRSGPAAMGRGGICKLLRAYGFKVARFPEMAFSRQETKNNGPHIFFWGPGTPEPKLTQE